MEACKIINIDMYEQDLLVVFGSKKYLESRLSNLVSKSKAAKSVSNIGVAVGHSYFDTELGVYYIWMREKPNEAQTFSILSHEIFHFATALMEKVGMKLTEESEEAYAYLIQFITKSILKEFYKL